MDDIKRLFRILMHNKKSRIAVIVIAIVAVVLILFTVGSRLHSAAEREKASQGFKITAGGDNATESAKEKAYETESTESSIGEPEKTGNNVETTTTAKGVSGAWSINATDTYNFGDNGEFNMTTPSGDSHGTYETDGSTYVNILLDDGTVLNYNIESLDDGKSLVLVNGAGEQMDCTPTTFDVAESSNNSNINYDDDPEGSTSNNDAGQDEDKKSEYDGPSKEVIDSQDISDYTLYRYDGESDEDYQARLDDYNALSDDEKKEHIAIEQDEKEVLRDLYNKIDNEKDE